MTAEIIKFGTPTTLDKLLDYIKEAEPTELIVISFKDDLYEFHHTEIESLSRIIGALERIKFELILED